MRLRARTAVIAIILVAMAEFALVVWHVSRPRVVARAVAPDGTQMCIIQKCLWWEGEFFTTGFVYRKPNQPQWGWFYYDHEDSYWGTARVVMNTNAGGAHFYRGETLAVTFDWTKESYTLHRWKRTLGGADAGKLPAGWSPEKQAP